MTDEESELEKRAVEELLRETDRARVRAETMGPAGWLKCPLRGTNKRFLLNTLRSTGLQREPGESKEGHSSHATTWESSCRRSRSRSPHAGRDSGHSRKRHRGYISSGDPKRMDRDREREMSHGRKGERDKTADRRTAEKDRRTTKTRTGSGN
ncbi:protein POLR1D-like isoform X2 [Hippocampus zosterae]|uniref:protein POLR1D-like isoform X2 n=1 Tax=Hippocampus zosterae TaxID=109293 RepID=UPI00223D73C9|nr:protein POLR1D-like isoform X2 [Hippocampus zosterae]